MPKRTDINSILIIGSGPIVIGQACEFDYSGVQACRALQEEGYKTILINSNPATIMTDPEVADKIYLEPIIPESIEDIIKKEQPDALLSTMGGQVALNVAMELEEKGILKKYNVELIGAKSENIKKAEDRSLFREAMKKISVPVPKSFVVKTLEEALSYVKELTFPLVIRPSFTLGGKGGSTIFERKEFEEKILQALESSPIKQALLEEYLLGWKEFELEMMRDKADNCIVVCSIENINPMGIHTGDSITVAPALTLTDKEFQTMRNMAISIMREIGIDTGGANVQFAVNPKDGRTVVIEMNPRVSRSSALASKATGFPIAKISAKLAVGFTLDEILNDITKKTTAAFEPALDYVVTKIPRFSFDKFPEANPYLTTSMKSIGEVMGIGRTFIVSFQKAINSLENGLNGFNEIGSLPISQEERIERIKHYLKSPTDIQFLYIAEAFRNGLNVEDIHGYCYYDPWFLEQIEKIIKIEEVIKNCGLPDNPQQLQYIKSLGFSNARLAQLTQKDERFISKDLREQGVSPVYKRVDTCAGEFPSSTPYLYSTYETHFSDLQNCEADVSDKEKVIIIGSGPNRIGQGIEFDYCCVQASLALRELGYETVMVNCNPETVSTDYTISDRLYFEPLKEEYVLNIIQKEQSKGTLKGVITQLGGQTPLNLISSLVKGNIPILGTSPDSIDTAEDRLKFRKLLSKLNLNQPINRAARSEKEVLFFCKEVKYPLILRPSYVIGGHKMEIIRSEEELLSLLKKDYLSILNKGPILVEQYLEDAKEIDIDAISDGREIRIIGIMEHFEKAGVHSGDSTCALPSFSLSPEIIEELEEQTYILCKALKIKGFINIQFAIKEAKIFVLEVNPRASRTVPFVSKAYGVPFAKLAAQIMTGKKIKALSFPKEQSLAFSYVKMPVFSFSQLPGAKTNLDSQMRSTGEIIGIGKDLRTATAKAYLSVLKERPTFKEVFIKVKQTEELEATQIILDLAEMGLKILLSESNKAIIPNLDSCLNLIEVVKDDNLEAKLNNTTLIIATTSNSFLNSESTDTREARNEEAIKCITLQHAGGIVGVI